jgi:hypothetical protein
MFSWEAVAIYIPLLIGFGWVEVSIPNPQFSIAQGAFTLAAFILISKLSWWIVFDQAPKSYSRTQFGMFSFIVFGAIGCLWVVSLSWVDGLRPPKAPEFESYKVVWEPPASIVVGTPLSGMQLNAVSSAEGAFVYDPPAGTVLSVGKHSLTATFYPNDSARYTSRVEHSSVLVTSVPTPPAPKSPLKPITLHQLFTEDFQNQYGFGFVPRGVKVSDGQEVLVETRLLVDPTAGVKYVAFYVPRSPLSYSACLFLANNITDYGRLDIDIETQGNSEPIFSKDYRFSGRVFIYHEDLFSPEQSGDLHKIYREKEMVLELRGDEYLQFEALRRLADNKSKPRQP